MAHWIHNLPVSISTLIDSENWYQRLKQELSYTLINSNMVSDTVALSYLEENGIDAIYDYEYGPWCDGYGSSVLVLNSKIIEILEIVPAHCLIEYEKYEKYENG
ncbi:hypothetical protein [Photobacterium kishitanii]|nr:hypothetical protein [Photobacterium kishitanii]